MERATSRPGRARLAVALTVLALTAIAAATLAAATPASAQAPPIAHRDLSYALDSPPAPAPAAQNALDVYTPRGARRGSRPVVVYAHGGGWVRGDKANKIADKVNLFTRAGYVFVSINYRLSPDDVTALDPGRVKHPDQPHDVGEALGWLDRNIRRYGGDPKRLMLMGHSAGAHLVSLVGSDPRYVRAYDVRPRQLRGVISLDTAAFDVARQATGRPRARLLFWNAFGTPEENAAGGSWREASPLTWADPGDPPFLLVTQTTPRRLGENRRMAQALGQPDAVRAVPLSHAAINDAVGAPGDSSGLSPAVIAFVERVAGQAAPPEVSITRHPRPVVRSPGGRAPVTFHFRASQQGARFECRLDGRRFRRCRSPRTYLATLGRHRFAVRALSADGRPGGADRFRFEVVRGPR